jgi:hypothetical protein
LDLTVTNWVMFLMKRFKQYVLEKTQANSIEVGTGWQPMKCWLKIRKGGRNFKAK